MERRSFVAGAGLALLAARDALTSRAWTQPAKRLNLLLITADDMNHDSMGCYGCPIADLTPNLDRLASGAQRFQYAYSTVAVCQPVREIMHTGLYPHRNGAMGFMPLRPGIRTLNQQLHDAGYLISMFGKNPHYQPAASFCVDHAETRINRHPTALAEATDRFLARARDEGRPFFHHVNCGDPHRPFVGTNGPNDMAGGERPSRTIAPAEVRDVPGFLEDLPEIRREVAQYYTSVRRFDDCVGAVLGALERAGHADDTLVMVYAGDHGMSFPFAKSNDYETSSRAALLMRWPGVTAAGSVDRDHLVSTIDFAPTLLDALSLPPLPDTDGHSFVPVLRGGKLPGWDHVFTFYNQTSAGKWLAMRSIRTKDRSYIWNAWSDGQTRYQAECMSGITWRAMLAAAADNPAIRERCDFFLHRVPQEFYDMSADRYERHNLIADPARQTEIAGLRDQLLAMLQRTGDLLAPALAQLDRPEVLAECHRKLVAAYGPRRRNQPTAAAAAAAAAGEDEG